jgi:hypothetical protein
MFSGALSQPVENETLSCNTDVGSQQKEMEEVITSLDSQPTPLLQHEDRKF